MPSFRKVLAASLLHGLSKGGESYGKHVTSKKERQEKLEDYAKMPTQNMKDAAHIQRLLKDKKIDEAENFIATKSAGNLGLTNDQVKKLHYKNTSDDEY